MNIIQEVRRRIIDYKMRNFYEKVITVSVEGLSNAGKSTIVDGLYKDLQNNEHSPIVIEGDKFHVGYTPAMKVYNQLIEEMKKGLEVQLDFPGKIWKFDMIKSQVLDSILEFNQSDKRTDVLRLEGVLTEKKDETEHEEIYDLSRNTILLMPGIFLRHLPFDYSVFLEVSPKISIERKIERARRDGKNRDPKVTELMVRSIEYPVMQKYNRTVKTPNLVIDMNDFDNPKIIESELEVFND